jgi:hypothetical protein
MRRHAAKTRRAMPSKGLYANYFEVGQTAFEVVLDFGESYRGQDGPPCHTRIVMTPVYAHALLQTLQEALEQHQKRFGRRVE